MSEREPGQLAFIAYKKSMMAKQRWWEIEDHLWDRQTDEEKAAWAAVERAVSRHWQEDMRRRAVESTQDMARKYHSISQGYATVLADQAIAIASLEIKDD